MKRIAVFVSLALISTSASAQTKQYQLTRSLKVGGEGGWDYLTADADARRLYVTRGTHVMVFDMDRDSLIGDLPNTPGVHGVALAKKLGRGFTSNGRDSSMTAFDLRTLAPIATVRITGRNPDAIAYDSITNRVFTFNGASANASVIDASTLRQVGSIDLGGKPEFGVPDGRGMLYVNIEDKSEVIAFDTRSLAVKAHYPLAPCEEPTGMARDNARGRLIIGCSNKKMAVMDEKTGRIITTIEVGSGVDAAGFDPANQLAFTSNGEGTLSVVREEANGSFTTAATIPTQRGARTMALDLRTHKIYMSTAEYGPAPAPTADRPRPRPPIIPGSFTVLVLELK